MRTRSELSDELHKIFKNVYYQPPETRKMIYPCCRYVLDADWSLKADDKRYLRMKRYQVTIIDKNPDSELPDEFLNTFQYCSFDRMFTSDNLNHWVFTLFY